ncbi:MAG: hypothetical protein HOL66_13155 [Rhodospirillaceae bacterium]|jgi:hypothetical protein|nr:hypothetical protein [Rhodospirillaceae bacterium]MBT5245179.1 hypothetical protein [Rhodospirillaceae bacterium]MBT5561905.1 hypothetical protein [Rhodospirillaceae bacterium]MBT6241977.1 hypothetical protein [Rhodospirillaceae bacterium]
MVESGHLQFVPYEELGDRANIIVDGAANRGTEITLSHWPKSGCPKALKADSSAEIVFNYLACPELHAAASAVSNNHFDQDGLVGLYSLINPIKAFANRDLLIDVAQAGDFAIYQDRRAARIAFTLAAYAQGEVSPLDSAIFALPYEEKCAALYQKMIPLLDEIIEDLASFEHYWHEEDQHLSESEALIRQGRVEIEEIKELDLAIITLPKEIKTGLARRFSQDLMTLLHPMAIHNKTVCNRILRVQENRYSFTYRYESWVQFISAPPLPRADLSPLAEELTKDEPGDAVWLFDEVSDLAPQMTLSGNNVSAIPVDKFKKRLIDFLATAPSAWDPFDRD